MDVKLQERRSLRIGPSILLLAGALVVGLIVFRPPRANVDIRRDAAVDAIEQVMPSVVNIATATVVEYHEFYDDLLREFYGLDRPTQLREKLNSIGSGVIIDEDGYLLTNRHILQRATRVQVKLWDGRVYEAERVVLVNPRSDVALLKLRSRPGEKFKAIKLAKDDDLLLGESVMALGNPYGLGGSVSRGILSSKNRRPGEGDDPLYVEDWLQTDAAINPGNSGGPLINLRGELIGLNVAYRPLAQGIGFAIPIKQVSVALSQFFTPEITDSLWFGARVKAGTAPLSIETVQSRSPADKTGLRAGQQILEVNGRAPKSLVDFNSLLTANKDHSAVLVVRQNGGRHTLKTQLVPFEDLIRQKLGLMLSKLTPERATNFPFQTGECLYVDEVQKDSPAERAQLQPGYLLTAIDERSTDDRSRDGLLTMADVLSSKKPGEHVQLAVVASRRLGESDVQFQRMPVSVPVR